MYDISLTNNVTGMNTSASNISLRTLLKIVKDFQPNKEQVGFLSANGKRVNIKDNTSEESYLIEQLDKVLKTQTQN